MHKIHQEFLEFMVESKERWIEQEKKIDQINLKIEVLTNEIQSLLANQMEDMEVEVDSK